VLTTTLKALKFPLKLISGLLKRKRKTSQKTELEKKQLTHVRNFDPTRLNNRSWQIRSGKKLTKKQRKNKKFIKSVNKQRHYEKQPKKAF